MSKSMTIAEKCLDAEYETVCFPMLQSIPISEPSIDILQLSILEWLRSFQPDSRASHSRLPETNSEKMIPETCGPKQSEPYAWYDHDTASWRTYQACLIPGTANEYSETWPRQGMMRGGKLYRQRKLEPRINEIDFGLWPSPTSVMTGETTTVEQFQARQARLKERNKGRTGNGCGPDLAMAVKMWPTPRCGDGMLGPLRNPENIKDGSRLEDAVALYPTPQSRDWKGTSQRFNHGNTTDCLPNAIGGQLNPTWVEWLMGWPLGWTDLEPLETDKFQQWLEQHGSYSDERENANF